MIRLKGYSHSLEEKGKLVHDIRVANRSTRCRSVPSALRNGSGIQSNTSIKVEDTCELKMSADIGMSLVDLTLHLFRPDWYRNAI